MSRLIQPKSTIGSTTGATSMKDRASGYGNPSLTVMWGIEASSYGSQTKAAVRSMQYDRGE